MVRFIVLCQGRTGSTYLTEYLSSHPAVLARGEIFASMKHAGAAAQLRRAREFWESARDDGLGACGFKTKLDDIRDLDSFEGVLRELDVKILLLKRRNLVKQVVSWMNGERLFTSTGEWNVYDPQTRMGPFELDLDDFEMKLQAIRQGEQLLCSFVGGLPLSTMGLDYESLFECESTVREQLCSFLQLPPSPMRGLAVKHSDPDLTKLLINFDALLRRYEGTVYERMVLDKTE